MPFVLLLTRFPAHYCIPALEFAVGFVTLGNYAIKGTSSLFAVRFLAGFCEAGFFPGVMFILGNSLFCLAKPNFWLSQADIDLANARMAKIERVPPSPWSKAKVKRIFSTWQIYLFPIMFPLPTSAIAAFTCVLFTMISDGPLHGRRWPIIIVCTIGNLGVSLALYLMPLYTNISGRTVAYYFGFINSAGDMGIYSWAAECTSFDNELRAVVSSASDMLAYTLSTISPNFVWKTDRFPAAKIGYRFSFSCSVALLCILPLAMFLAQRDVKIRAARKDEEQSQAQTPSSLEEEKDAMATTRLPQARLVLYGLLSLSALALLILTSVLLEYLLANTAGYNKPVPALLTAGGVTLLHVALFLPPIRGPSKRKPFVQLRWELLSLVVIDLFVLAGVVRLHKATPGLMDNCGGFFICSGLQGVVSLAWL
ncbi:hypothetical protein RQP46_005038 [Phenoliferia psychrophenolica]